MDFYDRGEEQQPTSNTGFTSKGSDALKYFRAENICQISPRQKSGQVEMPSARHFPFYSANQCDTVLTSQRITVIFCDDFCKKCHFDPGIFCTRVQTIVLFSFLQIQIICRHCRLPDYSYNCYNCRHYRQILYPLMQQVALSGAISGDIIRR